MNLVEHTLTSWDRTLFVAINHNIRSPLLDLVMPRISDLGLGHVQALALILLAVYRGRSEKLGAMFRSQRRWLIPMLLAFAMSGIGAIIIKQSVQRDRPNWFYTEDPGGRALNVHVNIVASRPPVNFHGFLSGHAATSAALATTATVLLWRKRRTPWIIAAWALTAGICFARIYLADHWPLDVAAGVLFGAVCGLAALRLCRRVLIEPREAPSTEVGAAPQVTECVAGTV